MLYAAEGQVYLDEVKFTPGALRAKVEKSPQQLGKLKEWQAAEAGRVATIVVETDDRWTELLSGMDRQADALHLVAKAGVRLQIAGHLMSPTEMQMFRAKVLAKLQQCEASGMTRGAFFTQPDMQSLEGAMRYEEAHE